MIEGFTKKYNVTRLAYYEETTDVHAALAREKQLKGSGLFSSKDSVCVIARNEAISRLQCGDCFGKIRLAMTELNSPAQRLAAKQETGIDKSAQPKMARLERRLV